MSNATGCPGSNTINQYGPATCQLRAKINTIVFTAKYKTITKRHRYSVVKR